jgi:hypothetical protein
MKSKASLDLVIVFVFTDFENVFGIFVLVSVGLQ